MYNYISKLRSSLAQEAFALDHEQMCSENHAVQRHLNAQELMQEEMRVPSNLTSPNFNKAVD
jgi:hypothetical protein